MDSNYLSGNHPSASSTSRDDPIDVDSGRLRATTIGTIVVRSGPIQMVIALLQSGDQIQIKVVELEPKLTTLGETIEETVAIQRDYEEMLKKLQGMPTPVEEFALKADKLLASKRINNELVIAMADTLHIVWDDILKLIVDRKHLLTLCSSFHEKMGSCRGKMAALEVACKDTMIPIEVEAVQEFLNKFKQLRIDVLAAVMATLKDGDELLAQLQDLAKSGTLDTRPDHIKRDAMRSIAQVQKWLENLYDTRSALEKAWQTRKNQLEQCLALAIIAKDLDELEANLAKRRENAETMTFSLGECEHTSKANLEEFVKLKQEALQFRDRGLKITRTTEKLLSSDCFAVGDEACARAYNNLSLTTEYLDIIEHRERWLHQSRDFFAKAGKTLAVLEKLEVELPSTKLPPNTPESFAMFAKVLKDVRAFTEEPLRLGYSILDDVGRTKPETQGVKRVLDEIENRKIYIENLCTSSSEEQLRIERTLKSFLEQYDEHLLWISSLTESFFAKSSNLGGNMEESKDFLTEHHKLMQRLEFKGEDINSLLESIKSHLESLSPHERYDVDTKAEHLHDQWIQTKDVVLKRVDLVSLLIEFFERAHGLSDMFDLLQKELKNTPDEHKLSRLEVSWNEIRTIYGNLKLLGTSFQNAVTITTDSNLETTRSLSAVEEILNNFSNRQLDVTTSLENWTTTVVEKQEIEMILEKIINENMETSKKTTTVDAQLYPVFTTATEEPQILKHEVKEKLILILQEIDHANSELQQRVDTTVKIQTNNDESKRKINEVTTNLQTLQSKLNGIRCDYESLLESILNYIENVIHLRQHIDEYFKSSSTNSSASEHEHFRENCMDKFRSLISQSEQLIDRVRSLEPVGAREYDTDRILKLLEQLRIYFESNNSDKMAELEKMQKIQKFDNDFSDIEKSVSSVDKQLTEIEQQSIDSLASAKTTSLAFEYFERTIELLDTRIENFKSTLQTYCNPENEQTVKAKTEQLCKTWDDIKRKVSEKRSSLDTYNEYYTLVEKIEAEYKEISYFLTSVSTKLPFLREPVEAGNLVNDIENYTSTRQKPLVEKLNQISTLHVDVPARNKISTLQTDITELFQSFVKLKTDITIVEDRLKFEEKIKEETIQREFIAKQKAAEDLQKREQERLEKLKAETEIIKETKLNEIFTEIKYSPPQFTKYLQDFVVREGEKVIFECEVNGNPEPNVEWFKDGISIQSNPDYKSYKSDKTCTLVIEEAFSADSATFLCRASNLVGSADTMANLIIEESNVEGQMSPPEIIRYLESGTAREGSSYHFSAVVTGNPLPTVQWYKNETCIDDSPDYSVSYNNGEALLYFEEVFLEDDAIYTCTFTNPIGFQQCSAKLLVEPLEPTEVPYFKLPLTNVMARVGQKIKLECDVGGIPRPDIYFSQNGKPYNAKNIKYENDRVTLVIPESYPKDAGTYVVTAKNLAGEAFSSCNVSVKGRLPNETSDSEMASDIEPIKPSVQLPLKEVVAIFEGKSVRLDCVIVGQPEPEVIWYHNNRPVKESADVQLLFQGDRCSLLIHEAYIEDAGLYKVVAINSAGEASSSCQLNVTPLNIAEPATRPQGDRNSLNLDASAPKFEKLLSDVLVQEGDSVALECVASGGSTPLTATWYLTNKEIFENDRIKFISNSKTGEFKLVFEKVLAEDKGVYTVKVVNAFGEAKCFSHLIVKSVNVQNERIVQVEVDEKYICPTFKELFSHKNAQIGDVVKFECIVKGKPTPKIKWFFNDQPVNGKNFLVSTSGERQVLTIPEACVETVGKVACVAENDIGKATCVAYLNLVGTGMQPTSSDVQTISQEHNTDTSRVTIKKQVFTTTSTSEVNSYEGNMPQTQPHQETTRVSETHIPALVQQKTMEILQKSDSVSSLSGGSSRTTRKQIAPRFTSELMSKIVDPGVNVSLEACYEGFPSPDIKVLKNGDIFADSNKVHITNQFQKVLINIDNVTNQDAGRYSVVATNPMGESTCTADVVVKKKIFPPVFGHRLQPQAVNIGDRVVLEVEVTGTPDPTVEWFKDNVPLKESLLSKHLLRSFGNSHSLVIEKAQVSDAGKYMVKATNSGGEAQSIANFVFVDQSNDMYNVKTNVFNLVDAENLSESIRNINTAFKKEPPGFLSEQVDHSTDSDLHATSESKVVTEHRCTTEATMRLEHKSPKLDTLPNEINTQTTNVSTNTDLNRMITGSTQTPPQVPPKPTKIDAPTNGLQTSSFEIFKKIEIESLNTKPPVASEVSKNYTKFDDLNGAAKITQEENNVFSETIMNQVNLIPGSPPEICFVPKPEYQKGAHISDKIKRLEEAQLTQKEAPMGGIALFPTTISSKMEETTTTTSSFSKEVSIGNGYTNGKFPSVGNAPLIGNIPNSTSVPIGIPPSTSVPSGMLIYRPSAALAPAQVFPVRSASPKPSADGVAMEKLWTSTYSDKESKYESFVSASENEQEPEKPTKLSDLKAPFLVQQITKSPPKTIPQTNIFADINLQPGSPPEICFAPPKPEERRRSLVETMEKTLEENLIHGPSRVLPHSVPTITPPIPQVPKVIYTPPPPQEMKKFKPPPPVIPAKLLKGDIYESDYETDHWKYSGSESDEPTFRPIGGGVPSANGFGHFKRSGYAADTEDVSKEFKKFESFHEMSKESTYQKISGGICPIIQPSSVPVQRSYDSQEQKEYHHSSMMTKKVFNSSNGNISQSPIQPPFVASPAVIKPVPTFVKTPIAPSPSKFVKSEQRESDYYSDYDETKSKTFTPNAEFQGFRSVKPPTPGRRSTTFDDSRSYRSVTPPTVFDRPPSTSFHTITPTPTVREIPIQNQPQPQPQVFRPKPLPAKFVQTTTQNLPPKTTMFYTAVAGSPLHLSKVATETSNRMQMKESTETSHRFVNMEQTKRIIHFDDKKRLPSTTPTPTKFIPVEFKESDYESEVDSAIIRPLWTPNQDEVGHLRYRPVKAPYLNNRSTSVPRTFGSRILSPMEFDQGPKMPVQSTENTVYKTQTLNRYSSSKKSSHHTNTTTRDDMNLKVGSPPKYGYMESVASKQMNDVGSTFRQKSHQFIKDISEDMRNSQTNQTQTYIRPGFKRAPSEGENKPHAYRDESRVSQFGTKCIDPNTGLIYFKYDFGYEFGILFPGEGKKFVGGSSKRGLETNKAYPLKHNGDVVIPVQHERSGNSKPSLQRPRVKEVRFNGYQGNINDLQRKRYSLPIEINIDRLHDDQDNLVFNGHNSYQQQVSDLKSTVPVNAHLTRDEYPRKPPMFITPLKDIACCIEQTARFECIVQSDPTDTSVTWSHNNMPLQSDHKRLIEFRNGVCRLTILNANPADTGIFACSATNSMGVATTSSQLTVINQRGGLRA